MPLGLLVTRLVFQCILATALTGELLASTSPDLVPVLQPVLSVVNLFGFNIGSVVSLAPLVDFLSVGTVISLSLLYVVAVILCVSPTRDSLIHTMRGSPNDLPMTST